LAVVMDALVSCLIGLYRASYPIGLILSRGLAVLASKNSGKPK
jgi:hypothetical protein